MFAPFVQEGIGLHTGQHARILVEMDLPGAGVRFLLGDGAIPARPGFLSGNAVRATILEGKAGSVGTVEHLLAALAAFGETDVRVTVEGPEIPILDGSALPFARALEDGGAEPGARFVQLSEELVVEQGRSWARLVPLPEGEEPFIRVAVEFDRREPAPSERTYFPRRGDFTGQIAPARTFAFAEEVDRLRAAGMARGGSLENALVLGPDGPLNPGGMRFDDEPARHKLLDAIGDLSLLGGLPHAAVELVRPGHRLLHALVKRAERCCIGSAGFR